MTAACDRIARHLSRVSVWSVLLGGVAATACGSDPLTRPTPDTSPRASFRLAGIVTEVGHPTIPVPLADVRSERSGLSATTTANGTFLLDGVHRQDQLRVTRDGFDVLVMPVTLYADRQIRLELHRTGAPPVYEGVYRLTIGSGNCDMLPPMARQRTYTATVTQDWPHLHVILSGADLPVPPPDGRRFRGVVHDPFVQFDISPSWWTEGFWWPDIVERLPDGTFFVVSGQARLTRTEAGLSGSLAGSLEIHGPVLMSDHPNSWPISMCSSQSHQFQLTR